MIVRNALRFLCLLAVLATCTFVGTGCSSRSDSQPAAQPNPNWEHQQMLWAAWSKDIQNVSNRGNKEDQAVFQFISKYGQLVDRANGSPTPYEAGDSHFHILIFDGRRETQADYDKKDDFLESPAAYDPYVTTLCLREDLGQPGPVNGLTGFYAAMAAMRERTHYNLTTVSDEDQANLALTEAQRRVFRATFPKWQVYRQAIIQRELASTKRGANTPNDLLTDYEQLSSVATFQDIFGLGDTTSTQSVNTVLDMATTDAAFGTIEETNHSPQQADLAKMKYLANAEVLRAQSTY